MNTPTFTGTGQPGTQVQLYATGIATPVALGFVDAAGNYTVTVGPNALPDGTYTFFVRLSDLAGNLSPVSVAETVTLPDILDPDRKFIRQIYFNALGRLGSLDEWNNWVPALRQPDGRLVVANAIEHSPEAEDHLVKGWYLTYLGRPALNGEESGWVNALASGLAPERVLSLILGTPEYFAHAPSIPGIGGAASDATFVTALYVQLLNRTPSAAEVAPWVSAIPQIGHDGVAQAFLGSAEYRSNIVTSYYSTILRRPMPPTPAEVAGWVNSGLDIITIRIGFEASAEFYFRITGFAP
jgi:hypothetical protein